LLALRGGLIEYLVEFYAAPPQAHPAPRPDDPSRILASLGVREVASISINSRAIEELLTTLLSTLLGALARDASVSMRMVWVATKQFPQLAAEAATLRSMTSPSEALLGMTEAIDEAISEAMWRNADLLIIAA
jgi:hypothetical protein